MSDAVIARVFPRKTVASPTDMLAFFREPTIENIADCIQLGVTEVHISVTFTWDLERAEELYDAWQILGVPVDVGGPAFDDRMGDFVPGMYLREGMIFTSLGCTKDCWFCSVPRCAHGVIRELPIADGWHISNLKIYDTPRELREFTGLRQTKFGAAPVTITRPPQSWCYLEELP